MDGGFAWKDDISGSGGDKELHWAGNSMVKAVAMRVSPSYDKMIIYLVTFFKYMLRVAKLRT